MEKAGITTLRARRIELLDKYAQKAAASLRFGCWFPLREGWRSARNGGGDIEKFLVAVLKAPFEWKPGKIYGERNIKYRDM